MAKVKKSDLSDNEHAVLAVLAQQGREAREPRDTVRGCSRLRGIAFEKAVDDLHAENGDDHRKLIASDSKNLWVTDAGWRFVMDEAEFLDDLATSLMTSKNEVSKEAASRRTSWTMRRILCGAAALVAIAMLATAIWMAYTDKTAATPTAAAVIMSTLVAIKLWYLAGLVVIFGLVVVGGIFAKMNRGIRQQNLKAIGITLVAVLVSLLAIATENALEAALGILGAIAGYLFGKDSSSDDEDSQTVTSDRDNAPRSGA